MEVFKFGGASVKSREGIENIYNIVSAQSGDLFVVVSAMGKTTNALEQVLESFMSGDRLQAMQNFKVVESSHNATIAELFADDRHQETLAVKHEVEKLYDELRTILAADSLRDDYDMCYDRIVGYGELLSTTIISHYFTYRGVANRFVDMRKCFVTDSRYREANINVDRSTVKLTEVVNDSPQRVFVGQGFIGATSSGCPTTLGREGSDYSAAMVAYILNAQSVSIWKDVDGVLNADPRIFDDAIFIPELTYLDAIELAYSGAQIIHPKTIKPLQNRAIPLYVRPFLDPSKPGTVIKEKINNPINIPIFILKRSQVLISIRPKDFSFVLEERLADIFAVFAQYRLKINLIQSSAVNLSLCVDDSRYLERVVDTLQADSRVVYNKNMEMLTIRGYDTQSYDRYTAGEKVLLVQKTRKTARIVRYNEL